MGGGGGDKEYSHKIYRLLADDEPTKKTICIIRSIYLKHF